MEKHPDLDGSVRHLAWLSSDDPVVAATMSHGWKAALSSYTPEPFRALG
jgi:hypothetical protein